MNKLLNLVKRIHRDDRGAEGLEKLLIIAAIVLPLLAVLLYFKDFIVDWVTDSASEVRDDSDTTLGDDPF